MALACLWGKCSCWILLGSSMLHAEACTLLMQGWDSQAICLLIWSEAMLQVTSEFAVESMCRSKSWVLRRREIVDPALGVGCL